MIDQGPTHTRSHLAVQSYLMFGNTTYLRWAALSYGSVLAHVAVESPALDQPWLLDVQMDMGRPIHFAAWSLSAYWPGYLALAGNLVVAHDWVAGLPESGPASNFRPAAGSKTALFMFSVSTLSRAVLTQCSHIP